MTPHDRTALAYPCLDVDEAYDWSKSMETSDNPTKTWYFSLQDHR